MVNIRNIFYFEQTLMCWNLPVSSDELFSLVSRDMTNTKKESKTMFIVNKTKVITTSDMKIQKMLIQYLHGLRLLRKAQRYISHANASARILTLLSRSELDIKCAVSSAGKVGARTKQQWRHLFVFSCSWRTNTQLYSWLKNGPPWTARGPGVMTPQYKLNK